ncbi:glycine zipper 2TM domain-containing protein [Sulfuricurvum sp.]|jgi:uncharacterized protein YcfJ|uniref:glycine zipper 2TM domain-containing protein n=1 Tax=Sulfuricurvum sp. TaxID=2025608 RepID=UPI0025E9EC01|nr:glycine zipper 2TM domain-containing protein [Sulfuricurvum sp.]
MKYFLYVCGLFALAGTTVQGEYLLGQGNHIFVDGKEYVPLSDEPMESVQSPSDQTPSEVCWYERVPLPPETDVNVGGAIVGGVIGGVLGHQIGGGSGKTAATIAGAAIGTAIGAKPTESAPRYQLIRRCNTVR